MRIRPVALAVVTAAALAGLAGPAAPRSAAAPNPFDPALDASPSETIVPATVVVTGSCPATNVDPVESDVVYQYPSSATLSFPAAGVESQDVALDPGGEFRESFGLPGTLVPGQYTVTLSCIEDESQTDDSVTVLPPPESPEPLGPATLSLDRSSGEVGDTVSATGTCPSEDSVELFFADVAVGNAPVDSSTDAFGPVAFPVPDVAPGSHQVTTSCGATEAFEVIPPPDIPATLELDPPSGAVGDDVTATGTCPLSSESATLSFGDGAERPLQLDPRTGGFTVVLPVPDLAPGGTRVTTDCGGAADFTVVPLAGPVTPAQPGTPNQPGTPAPTTPGNPPTGPSPTPPRQTETPDGLRIVVPDLTGMTEDEAIAALGGQLVLDNPTGGEGQVSGQVPPPGTLVEPASAVTVLLEEPQPATFPWLLVGVLVVVAVLAGLGAANHVRRRRIREERWLEEQVRTELQPQTAVLSVVPDQAVPGVDLRLEVRRHPARL